MKFGGSESSQKAQNRSEKNRKEEEKKWERKEQGVERRNPERGGEDATRLPRGHRRNKKTLATSVVSLLLALESRARHRSRSDLHYSSRCTAFSRLHYRCVAGARPAVHCCATVPIYRALVGGVWFGIARVNAVGNTAGRCGPDTPYGVLSGVRLLGSGVLVAFFAVYSVIVCL